MNIYGKYGDSLSLWKEKIHKILILIFIIFSLVVVIDSILILHFGEQTWKIFIGSLLILFVMKKDVLYIIGGIKEMLKKWKDISKGYSGEEKVATILNSMATNNPKITVIHDIFIGHENIDHIVIYDNRFLLLIETKAYKKVPYFLYFINSQIRRQWNYIHKKTGIYVKPLGVFTEAFVKPHLNQKEIDYININYLETYIRMQIEIAKDSPKSNMVDKILEIKNSHILKKPTYFALLVG